MSHVDIPPTIDLQIPGLDLDVIVTPTDEGIVVDVLDLNNEVVATTWRFYEELGLKKGDNNA